MTTSLPADPLEGISIAEFGRLYRSGALSSENLTRAYLARIEVLDPRLRAYEHVATSALDTVAEKYSPRRVESRLFRGLVIDVDVHIRQVVPVETKRRQGLAVPAVGWPRIV